MATGWDWEPVRAAAAAALGVAASELTIMGADDDDEVSDVGPPAVQLFLGSVGWQLVSNAHMDSERYLVRAAARVSVDRPRRSPPRRSPPARRPPSFVI